MTTSDAPTLREWLRAEPFGIALSSGFFGFFAHAGVMTALVEEGLEPVFASGSSAGALVVGGFAAGLGPDVFRREMEKLTKDAFWDPAPGLGLLRGRKFRALLDELLPVDDFSKLRIKTTISVFDLARMKTRVLDEGALSPAIHASCAVPLMFHPVRHAGGLLVDGGVADRPGVRGIPLGARTLYHHLPTTARWRTDRRVPLAENRTALVLTGLPRPSPNALEEGKRAYAAALQATRRALHTPVDAGRVDVTLTDSDLAN